MSLSTADNKTLKIFLVEDNEDSRVMLTHLLEVYGYEVQAAGTMQATLQDFPHFGSHVLLSDIGLPDGNGCNLLRELQQAGSSPYAIAMSGYGTLADVSASKEAGFRHHLVKPMDLDALEQLLEEARREITSLD